MTKGMTAALAAATVSLGLPAGLPAVTVFTQTSTAVASAPQSSFGRCVANEERTEHDASEAVVDCSA